MLKGQTRQEATEAVRGHGRDCCHVQLRQYMTVIEAGVVAEESRSEWVRDEAGKIVTVQQQKVRSEGGRVKNVIPTADHCV